jgi:hypothetical protein
VISASLREEKFLAAHCIDVMDRNLYERADDCRWWALNPTFKALLSQETVTKQDRQDLTAILQYINSLYTVYTNLFLFDKRGEIVAVFNPEQDDKIAVVLEDDYIKDTLKNNREDRYFVSPFSENRSTTISVLMFIQLPLQTVKRKKRPSAESVLYLTANFNFKQCSGNPYRPENILLPSIRTGTVALFPQR